MNANHRLTCAGILILQRDSVDYRSIHIFLQAGKHRRIRLRVTRNGRTSVATATFSCAGAQDLTLRCIEGRARPIAYTRGLRGTPKDE